MKKSKKKEEGQTFLVKENKEKTQFEIVDEIFSEMENKNKKKGDMK